MAFLSKRVARQCHRTVAGGGSSRIKPFFSSGRWLSAGANLKDSEELLFESADQHFKFLQRQAKLPAGFTSGAKKFEFRPFEAPDSDTEMIISYLAIDQPTDSFSGVFSAQGGISCPNVDIGKERMKENTLQAALVHNKIANIGTKNGWKDANTIIEAFSSGAGLDRPELVFPSGTGVIGWSLPINNMVKTAETVYESSQNESMMPFAMGIMTTDTFPKIRATEIEGKHGNKIRLVATAKGAGMIAPNMATLLVYVTTDANVDRQFLNSFFPSVVDDTFNNISLDGVSSPADTALMMSSKKGGEPESRADFEEAVRHVCSLLTDDIVRNGEGVKHVVKLNLQNAPSREKAKQIGNIIAGSSLVKTMISGNEPNIGRLVSIIGAACSSHSLSLENATISIGNTKVFEDNSILSNYEQESSVREHFMGAQMWESVPRILSPPVPLDEEAASKEKREPRYWVVPGSSVTYACPFMYPRHDRCVRISLDMGCQDGFSTTVYTGDLTHEYVSLNSEYRT